MSYHDEHLPEDLTDVVRRLRDHRPEVSPLELDRIKLRAKAAATSSRPKGSAMKSRLIVALCTVGLMAGGTGGVIAHHKDKHDKGAAGTQYKKCKKANPGHGANDERHGGKHNVCP